MTFTKADLIAAREATAMISKEAEFPNIFGGDPEKQKRAKAAHEIFEERQKSPEYWRVLANEELAGLDGQDLIDGQKAFVQRHSKELINQVDAYNKLNQGAASGGMLDRYSGSAGALGLGIGALLGGVLGGKSGALIGGLIGGIGLYAMQKLGIGGDSLQNFFKTTVDKVLGPQAGRVDKDKMLKNIQSAADEAKGGYLEGPATDATKWGETDPGNPNYNAGVSTAAPEGDFTPTIATVKQSAMDQFGEELTDGEASEILTGIMPGAEFTPEAVGDWLSKNRRPVDPLVSSAPPAPVVEDPNTGVKEPPRVEPITPPLPRGGPSVATVPEPATTDAVSDAYMSNTGQFSPENLVQPGQQAAAPDADVVPVNQDIQQDPNLDVGNVDFSDEQINNQPALVAERKAAADKAANEKKLQDAAIARRHKVKEQMKRQKSAIGRWRDPALSLKEGVGATAEGIAGGFERSGEGLVEGAGLAKDVGKAGLSKIKETVGGAKAVAEEGAGLVKDYANVGTNKAREFKSQANKWLGDKAKDIKYLFSGE